MASGNPNLNIQVRIDTHRLSTLKLSRLKHFQCYCLAKRTRGRFGGMYFGIKIISPLPQLVQMIWKDCLWRNQMNVQTARGDDGCF